MRDLSEENDLQKYRNAKTIECIG
ncbi:hypothetical protein [Bacillus sp. AFS023182]